MVTTDDEMIVIFCQLLNAKFYLTKILLCTWPEFLLLYFKVYTVKRLKTGTSHLKIRLAAAALGELTGLFPINQFKLTGFKKILMRLRILSFNQL